MLHLMSCGSSIQGCSTHIRRKVERVGRELHEAAIGDRVDGDNGCFLIDEQE